MSVEDPNKSDLDSKVPQSEPVGTGRRRFIKGAAATTPVILSIVSRPAMGARFCTPSGFLSGNLSAPNDMSCNGKSPGYYRRHFPSQFRNTTFSSVFGGVWINEAGVPWDPATTLEQVLRFEGDDDKYRLGFHATASFFNAVFREQLNFQMTQAEVINLVQQVLTMGYYVDPTTGVTMDPEEVKQFLQSTYH